MLPFGLHSTKSVKMAQKTEKATKKYNIILYNTWNEILKTYKKNLQFFTENILDERMEYEKSLIYLEMLAFLKRLEIVRNLALWGFYHSSLLELRFMMETTILAYYLDQQLPNTEQFEKIRLMQKHKGELWGARLRRRAYLYEKEFGEEIEKVIEEINNSIDKYMAEATSDNWKGKNIPFNNRSFLDCIHHSKNVTALILKHFIKSFDLFKYDGNLNVTYKEEEQLETKQLTE